MKTRNDGLTQENYFSQENQIKYMGVSQYKAFMNCEAAAYAELTGEFERAKSDALIQGSYVDAHFEGTLDVFKAKTPELFKRDGSLQAKYANLDYIIQRVEEQPLMMSLLAGEKQKIFTGEIAGVPVKIKVDSYRPDMIVDLKCMKDFAPIYKEEQGRLPWFEAWGYDTQGAVYQEIVYQNTGKRLPFVLVAVTKEKEPDVCVLEISQESMDFELNRFKENIVRIDAIKHGFIAPERCEKCDYCKRTKKLTEILKMEDLFDD